jgi:hypothetical protein
MTRVLIVQEQLIVRAEGHPVEHEKELPVEVVAPTAGRDVASD